MKEERKDNSLVHLNELAEYLALNHVIMSLPDLDSKENKNSDIKKLLPNLQIDINDKSRNIFVFGAGVSFDAYPNIFKLGDETASQIEAKFEFNNIVNASKNRIKKLDNPIENTLLQRYNEIKTKLIKKYDKESLSFETRLALLSHFVGTQKIRSEISKMFNQRLLPPFFYSLSAHLLKSRFIDGIINFNFEELLDQAIEEELGIGQQNFVISDGNIKDYGDLLNEEKLVEPFYVKPHGTASHSSTLRFTKDHYIEIPEKIELLLNQLLLGKRIKTESGSSNKEPYHQFEILNLIVSGFALESIEFNNILEKTIANYNAEMNHKKELNIFFINKDKFQKKSDLENKIRERITKNSELSFNLKIIYLPNFKSKIELTDLENFMHSLNLTIVNKFHLDYSPSLGLRHYLIKDVFNKDVHAYKTLKSEDNGRKRIVASYYFKRLIFEILLVIIKNKGYFQPSESLKANNRVGLYYHLYYEKMKKNNAEKKIISINKILEEIGLKSQSISTGNEIFYTSEINSNGIELKNISNTNINDIVTAFKPIFNENISKYFKNIDESYSKNLYDSHSLNYYPLYSDFQLNRFSKIEKTHIISSETSYNFQFREQVKSGNWNLLLIVSDRGYDIEPILDQINGNKNVILILADIKNTKKFDNTNIKTLILPYYDHNNHLKLFFNGTHAVDAFYYYKRGFCNNINALHFNPKNAEDNYTVLLEKFLGYYVKAVDYEKYKKHHVLHFTDLKDLKNKFNEIKNKDKFYNLLEDVINKNIFKNESNE